MNSVKIILKDRLDKVHILKAHDEEPLRVFLKRNYIPRDSVICYVNEKIIDDHTYKINNNDKIVLDMVRAYQLPEYCRTLRLWEDEGVESTKTDAESVYTKNVLWFNDNGICEMKETQFDPDSFVKYVDDMFVQGIMEKNS